METRHRTSSLSPFSETRERNQYPKEELVPEYICHHTDMFDMQPPDSLKRRRLRIWRHFNHRISLEVPILRLMTFSMLVKLPRKSNVIVINSLSVTHQNEKWTCWLYWPRISHIMKPYALSQRGSWELAAVEPKCTNSGAIPMPSRDLHHRSTRIKPSLNVPLETRLNKFMWYNLCPLIGLSRCAGSDLSSGGRKTKPSAWKHPW